MKLSAIAILLTIFSLQTWAQKQYEVDLNYYEAAIVFKLGDSIEADSLRLVGFNPVKPSAYMGAIGNLLGKIPLVKRAPVFKYRQHKVSFYMNGLRQECFAVIANLNTTERAVEISGCNQAIWTTNANVLFTGVIDLINGEIFESQFETIEDILRFQSRR